MKFRIVAFFCLLATALGRPALAQPAVGAGIQVGVGCQQGRENCAGRIIAPQLAVDLSAHFALKVRGFAFTIPDRTVVTGGISISQSAIKRRMILGDFIVKFRSGKEARPVLGVSFGSRRDSATVTCAPGPCSSAFGPGGASQFTDGTPRSHGTIGMLTGIQFSLTESLDLEAVAGLHDPFREEGRTAEAGVLLTVRLWKLR